MASRRFLRLLPALIVVVFVILLVIKIFVVQTYAIPSAGMEPTLRQGDRVLVQKISYHLHDPRRGDIIAFQDPHPTSGPNRGLIGGFFHWMLQGLGIQRADNEDFLDRLIGLPGDTVSARDGSVYVNGDKLREPYLDPNKDTQPFGPVRVPAGVLFVLGDNRLNSLDSRFGVGFVPEDTVIGKAFFVIWPPGRAGLLH